MVRLGFFLYFELPMCLDGTEVQCFRGLSVAILATHCDFGNESVQLFEQHSLR